MSPRLAGLPRASPREAGLDPVPLDQLRAALRRETHELQCLSGAAHIVLHRGRCVLACCDGVADRRSRRQWSVDTICKLHGCTKPLVSVAFLTLVDEGKVKLSDPISRFLKFSDRLKRKSLTAKGKRHAAAAAAAKGVVLKARACKVRKLPTLRNLLTMTAGLGYEHTPAYKPIMKLVRKGSIQDLAGLCNAISQLPLEAEPGTRYEYSFCTDVLGRVCEAISGQRLDRFVERRLLKPLGMKDTHFSVPSRKYHRMAVLYDAQKRARGGRFALRPWSHPEKAPGIMSGGGGVLSYEDAGMYSTVRDYSKFVQMLVDGGTALNGKRILSERTVRALWGDALAEYARPDGRLPGWNDADGIAKGSSWDTTGCSLLHTHLVFDKPPTGSGPPRRAKTMWMGGGGGTYWVADKERQLVSVSFTQTLGGRQDQSDGLGPQGSDAAPFAVAAVDAGRTAAKGQKRSHAE